jgi:hypothetical protein
VTSPVPKHLRVPNEYEAIPEALQRHVVDLHVNPSNAIEIPGSANHRAKFAPGLATALADLAATSNIGDPMCGVGTLAWETGRHMFLNDIDHAMIKFTAPLSRWGCVVSAVPATKISWACSTCIFSPPYYPKADRMKPAAHNDAKRGPVVGFRDSYACDHPDFIGNPGGVDAILKYRQQMTAVYDHLKSVCNRMIVVTKNWTRLGVEMRLDLDTILMAQSVGWILTDRHGWEPPPSLWSRFNKQRGGGISVEDVLVFKRAPGFRDPRNISIQELSKRR